MEIKKSAKADLERNRPQRFMLGLLVVLAGLFVALEYSITPDNPLDDAEFLDNLSIDEELAPLLRQENELSLAPKAEPEPSVKMEIVEEEEVEKQEEPEPADNQLMEGDMADDLPEPDDKPDPKADDVLSFRVVEELPQPPGGYSEFIKWLTRNLKYPRVAQDSKMQGTVVAEFIVNKDGSVTDVRIVRSLNTYCDREALRVLRMMQRWTAGVQNDQPCRTKVCIPIVFKL
jgi:protein TonB